MKIDESKVIQDLKDLLQELGIDLPVDDKVILKKLKKLGLLASLVLLHKK